jgi:hypothetical protein
MFALTAVVAVLLGIIGPRGTVLTDNASPFPQWWQALAVGYSVVHTILSAVAVTFVAYGIAWQRRGIRFFHEPGHWLLVEICVTTMLLAVSQLAFRLVFPWMSGQRMSLPMAAMWAITLLSLGGVLSRIVLDITIGVKKCCQPRWKWVFFTKAIAIIVQVLGDLVVILLLLRAGRVDRRNRFRRDAGHACGVWLQIALSSLSTVFVIVQIAGLFNGALFPR